jgi:glycosyltransferase involved in cell wall biosynthesis
LRRKLLVVTQTVDLTDSNLAFFHHWLEELAKQLDLVVIANTTGEYYLPSNVSVHSLGKEGGRAKLSRYLIFQKYLVKFLPDIDAVFFHMIPEYVIAAGLWPNIFGKKSLLWYTHQHVSWRLRIAEKLVDKIFTASDKSFRLKSHKVEITGHGIDTDKFKPAPQKNKIPYIRVRTAGRISPSKQQEIVIAVSEAMHEEGIEFEVKIAGEPVLKSDEQYLESLQEIIELKDLNDKVKFVGPISYQQIEKFYQSGDIFLNFSLTGSIDKAVLEALLCGLPVVTSNEAFRSLIPNDWIVPEDPFRIKNRVVKVARIGQEEHFREIVVSRHGLRQLIEKITHWVET